MCRRVRIERERALKNVTVVVVVKVGAAPNIPGVSDLLRCLAHATCNCSPSSDKSAAIGVGGRRLRVGAPFSVRTKVRARAHGSSFSSILFLAGRDCKLNHAPSRLTHRWLPSPPRSSSQMSSNVDVSCGAANLWLPYPMLLHRPLHKPPPSQFMCSAHTEN